MKYELSLKAQVKFRHKGKGRTSSGRAQRFWPVMSAVGQEGTAQAGIYAPLPKGTAVTQLWKNVCMYVCRCCVFVGA